MKIALVPDYLDEYGGAERTFEVFCEMFPNAPVFTLLYNPDKMSEIINKMKIIPSYLNNNPSFFKKRRELLVSKFPIAIEQFDLTGFDVVLSSGTFVKGLITKPETTHIFYCHRLMRSLWEKHEEYISEYKSKIKRAIIRRKANQLRMWDYLAADRVDYFIANSKNTQRQIKKFYDQDSEVIYPPVDVNTCKINSDREDYYLMVTRLGPFDQVELAIRAFNELGRQLIIVGDGPARKKLQGLAKSNIDFLGYKAPNVLVEYYASANAFISVGEESFGLTEAEAMASGAPVIAYKGGGVEETVIPGVTGEFFKKLTVRELVEAIEFFERNRSRYNSFQINQEAEKFDKNIFKQKIKDFIGKATGKRCN